MSLALCFATILKLSRENEMSFQSARASEAPSMAESERINFSQDNSARNTNFVLTITNVYILALVKP